MGSGHTSPSVPELPIGADPSVALNTGYALSKYAIERVTQSASALLGQQVKLLRVGQLCGSTATGNWSEREMWPIMFATSFHPGMRCLPELPGQMVDWIPVDVAAGAIAELLVSGSEFGKADGEGEKGGQKYEVHNITNPHPIPWTDLGSMLQRISPVEQVPMSTWVARLNALADAGTTPEQVPGLKLLQFFENMVSDTEESKLFETAKSEGISESLRGCPAFCQEWLDGNVRMWKETGFMT